MIPPRRESVQLLPEPARPMTIIVEAVREWSAPGGSLYLAPSTMAPGPGQLVTVYNHNGQLRQYVLDAGHRLHLGPGPCYTGAWPVLDEAVARHLAVEVEAYTVDAGGRVEKSEPPPVACTEPPAAMPTSKSTRQVGLFGGRP
ncbi:MAG TPA: hypothetical protein PLZ93_21365 [Nocardioides sp.]|nr:hypothetical protein [Nocardioides sp.]